MPSLSNVRFHAPQEICPMELADCPISDELAALLAALEVRSFFDVHSISLQDFQHLGDKCGNLALELGSVIRRAARGEFGKPYSVSGGEEHVAHFWWKGATGSSKPQRDSTATSA